MSFVFDAEHPNNWPLVQEFELKFLADLRSAVSVDSCEAVLQAVALIPLGNEAGTLCTLAQLLSYVTRVAKFFTDVSKGTLAKIESKVLCAALIRNWPQKMKHLILDSAPAIGETWEKMLQRFAEKVQQANDTKVLIAALTTPMHISAPLGQDSSQRNKIRRLSNNATINSIVQPESVDVPNPGNRLNASGFKDIGPLSCCDCGGEYYFTACEQAFYKSKNFEEQPKKCKSCRQAAKASSPNTSGKGWNTVAPSTQSGWGSSGTGAAAAPPAGNAKDLWTSLGRTWPPKPGDLLKGNKKQ